ncbi:MAG: carboxypeptidase-like regulatory domain-containing protein [Bacteroidota bacterium]|nr:carboxypeptidase-like regulatory domain-containing protein [Bacteroidota bacterium]
MNSKNLLLFFSLLLSLQLAAQVTISGFVKNTKQEPLAGASISLENSYSGTTSAADGSFSFIATDTGTIKILISITGYKSFEQVITPGTSPLVINAILKESITELKAVILTAGSFEASDKKRTTVLKSIDIVTTAGQEADIVAALKTLPGAQQVGETEGLFVRGGTGAETKVFIDGMMVSNPFYSSVPDIAQRGRFSPLLFKGTIFSSGGYSAQYGQGLSSALVLESLDLPTRSETNWVISSAQLSVTGQKLNQSKNGSIGGGIAYSNLAPYFNVVKQKYDYTKAPELINTELHVRQKTKKGMFKLYGYANHNTIAFNKRSVESQSWLDQFKLTNRNIYTNLTYTSALNEKWKLYSGVSFSYNKDNIQRYTLAKDTVNNYFLPNLTNITGQARIVFTRNLPGLSKLNIGAEWQYITDKVDAKDSIPFITIHDSYIASFAEADIYITSKFAARTGVRADHSSLLDQTTLSPRISLAYKLNDKSQVSAAYGDFYQKPETNYLFRNRHLSFTKAAHFIFNYQHIANGQTLRLELFYKNYDKLITYPLNDLTKLTNNGDGYARGIEFFWRDKKTFKGFDYWIAYSYLDTKRKFLYYPYSVQPDFTATHTASLVAKKFVESISTYFSMTYSYASGRPYYNPNRPLTEFMKDRTIDYNTMGFQLNFLTQISKSYVVFIFNMSNVLGSRQVYTYRFATIQDADGTYHGEAITPLAKRFFFVGAYLSIGVDRRKSVLD